MSKQYMTVREYKEFRERHGATETMLERLFSQWLDLELTLSIDEGTQYAIEARHYVNAIGRPKANDIMYRLCKEKGHLSA